MDVSVIVPARNEASSIAECVRALIAQTYDDLEIIVINSGSTDDTAYVATQAAAGDPRVRIIDNAERTTPSALNLGIADARGVYLIRVDAHAVVPRDYVERIIGHLRSGKWGGVGGLKLAVGGTTRTSQAVAISLNSRFGVGNSEYRFSKQPKSVDHIPFGAYRLSDLRAIGGWDPTLYVNQDFELDYRLRALGKKLLLDPDIVISWKSSQTISDLIHQYQRYGEGKVRVLRKHPNSVALRHLAPLGLAGGLITALWATAATRDYRPAALIVVPYASYLARAALDSDIETQSNRVRALVACCIASMHLAWAYGFVRGAARMLLRSGPVDRYRIRDLSQSIDLNQG